MSVYSMKNPDGSVNGYKASTAFTIKVNDVETGKTTESQSFQTEVSPLMLSPESAINEALKTIEPKLYTVRIIYDDNANDEWDTGNYLAKKQPEEIIYFPKLIDVRANWDVEQDFILD
jgi:hypothetical protein